MLIEKDNTHPVSILLVEDNPGDTRLIKEFLKDTDLVLGDLRTAKNLEMAIKNMDEHNFDVVLLDLSLPDSHGLDTVTKILERVATIPIVVLTGNRDESLALEALHQGAQDYLRKDDVSAGLLDHAVRYAIERHQLNMELSDNERRYRGLFEGGSESLLVMDSNSYVLEDANHAAERMLGYRLDELLVLSMDQLFVNAEQLFNSIGATDNMAQQHLVLEPQQVRCKNGGTVPVEISLGHFDQLGQHKIIVSMRDITERLEAEADRKHHHEQLRQSLIQTIEVMAITIEKRDPYTAGHQKRVAHLASAIAKKMGLPQEQIDGLHLGGMIHDIGKIYVPAEILNRPGSLSEVEKAMINSHPKVGFDIVKNVDFNWPVSTMVMQHHERIDGSGYPEGLSGDDIFMEARIIAVADVIEAMASHRPYRPALGIDAALEEIKRNKGKLYDAAVSDAALVLFSEDGFEFEW